jgi:SAM-dependent methyltransferase
VSTNFDSGYTDYQRQRSWLRRQVRRAYLASAASKLQGPTLDFGCGVGELLSRLPAGSMGVEYNPVSVEYCRARGLDVAYYDGFADNWSLSTLPVGRAFRSVVISHVLEHLERPVEVLSRILSAAASLGVERALVIVPGRAGYRIDATHLTFVDLEMLAQQAATGTSGFILERSQYFPFDWRQLGDWLPHHELQVVYTRNA